MFYHLNFTADISVEDWQTADDIRENTDETEDSTEPALVEVIPITGEDLENSDVADTSAAADISDERLERKPEEELFVLVDDDLDNDIISTHAAAFHRFDPQLDQTSVAATSQPLSPSKTSAAEGDTAKKMAEKTDADDTYNVGNESTAATTSEKASPKRLVFGADWVLHQHSQDCEYVNRYHFM